MKNSCGTEPAQSLYTSIGGLIHIWDISHLSKGEKDRGQFRKFFISRKKIAFQRRNLRLIQSREPVGNDCAILAAMTQARHLVRNDHAFFYSLRLLVCAVMLNAPPALAGNSIPLAWNPSAGSNVAGYKIYYGVASHFYTYSVNVGNVTNAVITGLSPNKTYYFAAKTYDILGVESSFSNEAILTVPPTSPTLTPASYASGQFAFNVSGVTNYQCIVQASTNMVDWVSVQTNTAPFTFVDANASQFQHRFYRTINLLP
jgi:hypothetical protein